MWVSQRHNPVAQTGGPSKIFAYDMATKAHKPTEDFNTLVAAGNGVPTGIWSDGTTMFVADEQDRSIYAYDMATKQRTQTRRSGESRVCEWVLPSGGCGRAATSHWVVYRDLQLLYSFPAT